MSTIENAGGVSDPLLNLSAIGKMMGGKSVKTVRRYIQKGVLPKGRMVSRSIMLRLSEVEAAIQRLPLQA